MEILIKRFCCDTRFFFFLLNSKVNYDKIFDFKFLLLGTSIFNLVSEQEKVDRMVPIKERKIPVQVVCGFCSVTFF